MDGFTHPNDAPKWHRWTLRNGWEFNLLEVEGEKMWGSYKSPEHGWISSYWDRASGSYTVVGKHAYDLIDAPREHTVWVFIDSIGFPHAKVIRPTTYDIENLECKALKQITITEGEGL